ncbi:MAG: ribonuclease H-like domain-containing protein [Candidatus Dojkabacteria bacterium]|nr:MAG: ribonuclease H-like domain-containing protein [Candidatus Dojkabacteria bacterium]
MIFLDIETQNDWTSGDAFQIKDMKISYTGVIDSATGKSYDFWESDMEKLGEMLKGADKIVHYNGFTFDMPVIANYLGEDVMNLPQIDLMVAIQKKIGFRPKLDDVANATLGHGKNGSGADAVRYWVSGDLESLKKYCLQDVKVTMELYDYGVEHGVIKYYDRSGFLKEAEIDWSLGEKQGVVVDDQNLSLF